MDRSDRARLIQSMGFNLDMRSLDRLPKEFLADQSGYRFTQSPYAPSNKYESAGFSGSGYTGIDRGWNQRQFYLFKEKPDRFAELQAEQQRLAGIQQQQYETQQADISSQLKILQEDKSALSKAQEDYSNMLIAEATRKREAEEQAARDLQTQRANQAMAGRSGSLRIQGASTAPRMGGTSQFRRRTLQQGTASPYKGLSTIQSGMVNV